MALPPDLTGALGDLLRRAHRDELLPLAEILGVRPADLGLADLAATLDRTLRRRGRHELLNLVYGGPPTYAKILRGVAERSGVPVERTLDETEAALQEWALVRSWEGMDASQRDQVWAELGESPPPPEDVGSALALTRKRVGQRQLGTSIGLSVAGTLARTALFFPAVGPMVGCLAVLWMALPRHPVLLQAVLEVARLRQIVLHRVTVGVVGSPSAGKDAAVNALFGIDTGNVSPVAGSTREVEITRLEGASALYIVNTPGLGDVIESVTEEARQVLDHVDVYVYVVNAQGGVQARELGDYQACLHRGRPVLAVVNKIDTLRERDRARYLADARNKLGAPEADFLAAAFDPLPQLSDAPLGLHAVQRWLTDRLVELGKDATELPWVEADAEGR